MINNKNATRISTDDGWVKNLPPGLALETLQRVQQTLLQMMKEMDAIFRKNGIHYFINYGTLLGAVRHGGFIPWDDDLDICIFENEYENAIALLRKHLSKSYIVHDKLTDDIYWCDFSKIRHLNSETVANMWPEDNKLKYRGICLDVFKMKAVSNSEFHEKSHRQERWDRLALIKKETFRF